VKRQLLTEADSLADEQSVLQRHKRKVECCCRAKHHDGAQVDRKEGEFDLGNDLFWCLAFENAVRAPED
jgi:hypothetical protein